MKVAAIIAEYNPFHNGHLYHIAETRRLTGADYVLAVMSGNFVQRGAPALCNKYLRTQMALLGGADAVLELPSLYATSSAEYFARGAVSLLENLGVIDFLSFGSESGELSPFLTLGELLCAPSASYEEALHTSLKEGLNFPAARQRAILTLLAGSADDRKIEELLSAPNNILGLEYCKALFAHKSSIIPLTIQRKGAYHDKQLADSGQDSDGDHRPSFSSASAIRGALKDKVDDTLLKEHLPEKIYELFCAESLFQNHVETDDFSSLLQYKLLMKEADGYEEFLDCSRELSDKIRKHLPDYTNMDAFIALLKSKDVTHTRLSRLLFHILLDMRTPAFYQPDALERRLPAPYARLLGFRRLATPLLSAIKQNSSIPLISKLADGEQNLTADAASLLRQDIFCASVYESVASHKSGRPPVNEYRQSPVILEI